ncbi:MAG: EthD family reductase [Acidimicrobiales bacterium]|nr:EthD family reductase [Acidimicrobiales bacterium]
MITLHALLVRRPDLTHEQFLAHWHDVHGPLIRDEPTLARHLLSYVQHPLDPTAERYGLAGFDGVTVQTFADADAFRAFVSEPEARRMDADMANFLDVTRLQATITGPGAVVVGGAER